VDHHNTTLETGPDASPGVLPSDLVIVSQKTSLSSNSFLSANLIFSVLTHQGWKKDEIKTSKQIFKNIGVI